MDRRRCVRPFDRPLGGDAVRKTKRQLVAETEEWIGKNPDAYMALKDAAALLSDAGKDTPVKFLAEAMRYGMYIGTDAMHGVIDALSGVGFAKGAHAIPNEIVSGIARRLAKDMEGREGFRVRLRKSRFDDEDGPDQPSLFEGVTA